MGMPSGTSRSEACGCPTSSADDGWITDHVVGYKSGHSTLAMRPSHEHTLSMQTASEYSLVAKKGAMRQKQCQHWAWYCGGVMGIHTPFASYHLILQKPGFHLTRKIKSLDPLFAKLMLRAEAWGNWSSLQKICSSSLCKLLFCLEQY